MGFSMNYTEISSAQVSEVSFLKVKKLTKLILLAIVFF